LLHRHEAAVRTAVRRCRARVTCCVQRARSAALAAALTLLACSAASAPPAPAFKRLAPKGLADSQALWNYSQVIVVEPGARLVEVAGTTGDDESGNMVSPDMRGQVERTFANVAKSLRAVGATGRDVIRVRMYVVGLDADKHWPIINEQMRRHFGDRGPAATLVGIRALAAPDILFEMDATAALRP
jgi:enamine deaminase RidA (YjgF/YER057c/UK114 family)